LCHRSPAAPVTRATAPGLAPVAFTGPSPGQIANKLVPEMLDGALARLEEIVDQETAALTGYVTINLKDFNDRKNHALVELTRAMRLIPGGMEGAALNGRVDRLRYKVKLNRIVLRMHLEAVREVSTTISNAIRDAESDGTYSQAIRSQPRPQRSSSSA
jgi:hypothetical protein